jgi:hypothetical protein
MSGIAVGGILQRGGIEVAVVMLDEIGDGAWSGHGSGEGLKAKGRGLKKAMRLNEKGRIGCPMRPFTKD